MKRINYIFLLILVASLVSQSFNTVIAVSNEDTFKTGENL